MPKSVTGVSVGERIAIARKVTGLNQQALAQRASYSVSMIRAVEQGREPASPSLVAAVAKALRIETSELYGQPYRGLLNEDGGIPGMSEIQTLFAEGSFVEPVAPPSLDELKTALTSIQQDRRSDHGRRALARIPVLLRQLSGAVESAATEEEREHAYRLLARTYGNTAQLTYRFGWLALASSALDRMEQAAEKTGEPLLTAHAIQQRSLILLSHAAYDTGLRLIQRSLDLIPAGASDEDALALQGSAHLRGAILAARARDRERAEDHITEARRIGHVVGRESTAYDTNFGPGNVEIHRVAVELETGDPGKAARLGSRIRIPEDVKPTRTGHHWQDVARAWTLAGDHTAALRALNNARRVAPQQTRYHPQVHETIRAIAAAEHRNSTSVAHFADWLGVKY
ncbi:helix-turn-helix domain-containing protein [Actinorugispora endophytica]|uniref:Helix-turn-helix protein n=1 Tax=Actinorugispora endophytica TaxID=1605990 RepID=A0A4R6V2I9_9ACTN|nr:helix-turn-helix transcriptional regulator [Actinorugispora endophytica]TDQ52890.1 helix-turn-helix protein [Actinorugispora endophytica]